MKEEGDEQAFSAVLRRLVQGATLTSAESTEIFGQIMKGCVPESQLAAFLTALAVRGETEEELLGAVRALRGQMRPLSPRAGADSAAEQGGVVDVCGTGGDGLGTLNVSTATAFVLAGLGVPVAKHGGRALSSRSGATDVLEKLGIPPEADMKRQARRLAETGLVFLAAPFHHPAMKQAAAVRKALGFRTLFNLLGPLCNPANVTRQLVGVFSRAWCDPVANVLETLGSHSVWVVHGETEEGGIDELTLAGPSFASVREQGRQFTLTLHPEMAGLKSQPVSALRGGDVRENARRLEALLQGEKGCYRDTVLFNAAVGLHVAGRETVLAGEVISPHALQRNVALAAACLDSGRAYEALQRARESVRN
ncbi:anthranilate phosphoribosyltransferase [Oecophyllibacter saccharovorans]|uniref:anthranilate phosphoribosyltransferase n=1 Tax=Oecophyllibacter saccharovorans TaxID=2558360 RepID=UPI0011433D09|nr:anthranilate phosphoribosyltransferase [Oecophyllibacter saccharovorans]QDH15781.1 anthranilate phosphoribosyltransferase [Oecophyllibacter saccharovorans]